MTAANYAGRAINITQTTAPHAMSYKLTSMYGLPHGHAVALCLPLVWQHMIKHPEHCIDKRGATYLEETFHDIAHALGFTTPHEAAGFMQNLLSTLGLGEPRAVHRNDDLETLTTSVNPIRLKNNPAEIPSESMKDIYNSIIK